MTPYSIVCGQIWPNFEFSRDFMVVLHVITCKLEDDLIKSSDIFFF